jgi:hypothetical protein
VAPSYAPQTLTTHSVRGDPLSIAGFFDLAAESNTSGISVPCNWFWVLSFGLFVSFFLDGVGSFCDFLPVSLL